MCACAQRVSVVSVQFPVAQRLWVGIAVSTNRLTLVIDIYNDTLTSIKDIDRTFLMHSSFAKSNILYPYGGHQFTTTTVASIYSNLRKRRRSKKVNVVALPKFGRSPFPAFCTHFQWFSRISSPKSR